MRLIIILCLSILGIGLTAAVTDLFVKNTPYDYSGWSEYLGGPDRNHYSALTQITPENVAQLTVAWRYFMPDSGQTQCSPIMVDGLLYGVTNSVQAFALEAGTGNEVWRFGDPLKAWHSTSRGLAYWREGNDRRILFTIGSNLYALDALTGKPIDSFGDKGKVDLHTGLPESAKNKFIISNTPGTVFEDLIIMPLRLSEDTDAAPGDIRAFNIRTGKLAWTFHTIPHKGEKGAKTFPKNAAKNGEIGAANNWAGMAVDRERAILYVPTGSASYDFYGGNRAGQNLFANCLLALDARTGKRLWHFQTTHHDIWDRDLPAPPNLLTLKKNGQEIPAVAQITKQGYVYIFNRVTGEPFFPIEELPAPPSVLAGEKAWKTQPLPTKPHPYARQAHQLTENDISPYAENREELIAQFRTYRREQFAPPSTEGTVILPGFDGGGEWGGAAADPNDGILYVNSNEMAWILTMVSTQNLSNTEGLSPGGKVYKLSCSACHGANREGSAASGFPSLVKISSKKRDEMRAIIANGKGMMPGFPQLTTAQKEAVLGFLYGDEKIEVGASSDKNAPTKRLLPYRSTGYNKFLDSKGLPAISPPWGTLNAINLNTGNYLWKIPFGETLSLKEKGIAQTGCENYGGPIITASHLLFIGATKDERFRAYDKRNGKLLWETELPAAAYATPITYQINGKQYVVIACGGGKLGTKKGNQYIAFALP